MAACLVSDPKYPVGVTVGMLVYTLAMVFKYLCIIATDSPEDPCVKTLPGYSAT